MAMEETGGARHQWSNLSTNLLFPPCHQSFVRCCYLLFYFRAPPIIPPLLYRT